MRACPSALLLLLSSYSSLLVLTRAHMLNYAYQWSLMFIFERLWACSFMFIHAQSCAVVFYSTIPASIEFSRSNPIAYVHFAFSTKSFYLTLNLGIIFTGSPPSEMARNRGSIRPCLHYPKWRMGLWRFVMGNIYTRYASLFIWIFHDRMWCKLTLVLV